MTHFPVLSAARFVGQFSVSEQDVLHIPLLVVLYWWRQSFLPLRHVCTPPTPTVCKSAVASRGGASVFNWWLLISAEMRGCEIVTGCVRDFSSGSTAWSSCVERPRLCRLGSFTAGQTDGGWPDLHRNAAQNKSDVWSPNIRHTFILVNSRLWVRLAVNLVQSQGLDSTGTPH